MSLVDLINYTNQNEDIAVAIKPIYVNKTNLSGKAESMFMTNKTHGQADFFIWIYKVIVSNDSNLELTLQKYNLTTINENGLIKKLLPDQSNNGLMNIGLKIKPNSVFETNDIVSLSSRSGIMYGECIFVNKNASIEYKIKIPFISLDSGDSKKMPN